MILKANHRVSRLTVRAARDFETLSLQTEPFTEDEQRHYDSAKSRLAYWACNVIAYDVPTDDPDWPAEV